MSSSPNKTHKHHIHNDVKRLSVSCHNKFQIIPLSVHLYKHVVSVPIDMQVFGSFLTETVAMATEKMISSYCLKSVHFQPIFIFLVIVFFIPYHSCSIQAIFIRLKLILLNTVLPAPHTVTDRIDLKSSLIQNVNIKAAELTH